jgi:phosphate transport system substrate-binding protein
LQKSNCSSLDENVYKYLPKLNMFANQHRVTLVLLPLALSLAMLGGCKNKADNAADPAKKTPDATVAGGNSSGAGDIKIDGSSTVFPISEAIAESFGKANAGKKVSVGTSGTGGGFKKFCRGETDISDASRPILQKEIDECKAKGIDYLEIPIAYDALTVVVNPANTWAATMKVADLKKMWEPAATAKVMKWKDVNPAYPDAKMTLFGAGKASGTFDYFTEAINGKSKESRTDYTATEDDNVTVKGVSGDKNALGYFGYSYYEANKTKLKAVGIDSGKGAVLPSVETVKNGTYAPLSRPLFIYVSSKSLEKPGVKEFVDYYMAQVPKASAETKYIPLPETAYTKINEKVKAKKLGTVFGGKEAIGLKIDEILAKESK